jgi:hypothetical protein
MFIFQPTFLKSFLTLNRSTVKSWILCFEKDEKEVHLDEKRNTIAEQIVEGKLESLLEDWQNQISSVEKMIQFTNAI